MCSIVGGWLAAGRGEAGSAQGDRTEDSRGGHGEGTGGGQRRPLDRYS